MYSYMRGSSTRVEVLAFDHALTTNFKPIRSLSTVWLNIKLLCLQNFYQEVSTPLLSDLRVRYLDNTVNIDSVTQTDYSNWFNGTEIVIAGKLKDNSVNNIIAQVSARK